jgi:hypothetical protein
MPGDSQLAFLALGPWLEELLQRHAAEIRSRALVLQLELDPEFVIEPSDALGTAFRELLRLILATVPDGCEIYLGSARSTAPVSRLGAGHFNARWQVAGRPDPGADCELGRLHPRSGDAAEHAQSALAARIVARFAATRWNFALEILEGGREILARAWPR